ncbi:MAG TPA: carbohydrate kinase family protein [Candidatus Saccharimonadaceae bacterium]|nr:carbohydrate kinase family protein [Candidatus Saccharimonadaceae bacterium]
MSKNLQLLLGVDNPVFHSSIRTLEDMTGHSAIDVKLLGDILARAHMAMRAIGIDPNDTTAEELYYALSANEFNPEIFARTHYAGLVFDGQVVSLNYQDIVKNRRRAFEARVRDGLSRNLREELAARYKNHPLGDEARVETVLTSAGLGRTRQSDGSGPRVLAVGDIITDAFIKLDEKYAESYKDDKGYQRLSFELGAKLPYDSVDIVEAVECSPNAAVSMTRLGLQVSLMSWLGDDAPGQSMVKYLAAQGVSTDDLVVEKGMKSNYHYVLRYGADRTKLQKFEDYAYQWKAPRIKPDWFYLGVLGEKTWPLHEAMLEYLEKNPRIKLAFQPGMYHLIWGAKKMKNFYKRAEIVILNREEAVQVTGADHGNVPGILDAMHALGIKVAVVTDGADGAYASDGAKKFFMPNYPDPKKPLDRTGAGDAFASTLTAALALGHSLEEAMAWAPINSMSVVQQMGAQAGLITQPELEKYLRDAPKNYKVKELS